LKKVWVNYYERVDKDSLAGFLPIKGVKIGNVDNIEVVAAEFTKKQFYLDNRDKATAYPGGALFAKNVDAAHIWMPYDKTILDSLKDKIAAIK
jgi:hypothetical protein